MNKNYLLYYLLTYTQAHICTQRDNKNDVD
jgi:hypothetical protein